jgi:hypothetical protein
MDKGFEVFANIVGRAIATRWLDRIKLNSEVEIDCQQPTIPFLMLQARISSRDQESSQTTEYSNSTTMPSKKKP